MPCPGYFGGIFPLGNGICMQMYSDCFVTYFVQVACFTTTK